jgi:hypothetical protein
VIIGIVSLLGAMGVAAADAPPAAAQDDYKLIGPSEEVLARYRPDFPGAMRAVVNCVETPHQTLGDCKVASTIPAKPDSEAARIADRALHVVSTMKVQRPDGWKAGPTPEPISVTITWVPH